MKRVACMAGLVLVLGASAARASDPVGIYARVDKVVLEPSAQAPERIQVWGSFCLAKEQSRDDYEAPVRGYLYYRLSDRKDVCLREWADLKKVAGTGQCVAFAARGRKLGTVRKGGETPRKPDPYPVADGLFKVEGSNPQAKLLKERLEQ